MNAEWLSGQVPTGQSAPIQPACLFDDVATECPNVHRAWVTDASHFSNLDQPEHVADAINRFIDASGH
ncbi:MAG: hypothetical protein U9R72_12130 [Chloroflexota bacterium]|nr:hypothetical protein [Chloroflexota bacterium]